MIRFGILVPVGPSQREIDRLKYLIESVVFHEPSIKWVVIIDDSSGLHSLQPDQSPRWGLRRTPPVRCVRSLRGPIAGIGGGRFGTGETVRANLPNERRF